MGSDDFNTLPANNFCSCCGVEIECVLWCRKCLPHVGKSGALNERTYFALNGKECPYESMNDRPAQQPDGRAEGTIDDALDQWWFEDHFGDGCEIGGDQTTHSEKCVEAAFKDGYAAGQRALPESPLCGECGQGESANDHDPAAAYVGENRQLHEFVPPASPEREAVYREVDALIGRCAVVVDVPAVNRDLHFSGDNPFTIAVWAAASKEGQ